MKKTIITICVMVLSVAAFATDAPKAVKEAFAKKFPSATNVKWDKENAHEYEAAFKQNGKSFSANYSDKGDWLETESTIEFNMLPQKIQQSFKTNHKEAAVKVAAKIETSKGVTKYEVEFKSGKKTVEEFYAEDGSIIKA